MPRKLQIVAGIIVLAVLLLAAGAWLGERRPYFITPPEPITIADVGRPAFGLVYVAQAKGFFRDENLDVSLRPVRSSDAALEHALGERTDLANVFDATMIEKYLAGAPVGVIATLGSSKKNTGLLALKKHGIQSPEDLRGKRVGVTRNSNSDFFLHVLLTSAGIRTAEVRLVDIRPEEMTAALHDGRVDAIATWNPFLSNARNAAGEGHCVTLYSEFYSQFFLLAGNPNLIARKKPAVIATLRALAKAEDFLRHNRIAATEIVARHLSNYTHANLGDFWDEYRLEVTLDNLTLSVLSQKTDWFSRGETHKAAKSNLRHVILNEYLSEANSKAVTIRRVSGPAP